MLSLNYKTYGEGPPLIVLHGLFGSLENWHHISTLLSRQFRVFSLDQRNHGRSPHSQEIGYPALAADLAHFMDERGLAESYVLGHSMGGKTAMQFALQHPGRVSRLIVVDIGPQAYGPSHRPILDALLGLDLSAFETRLQMDEALVPAIPDQAVRQFLLKGVVRDSSGKFTWRMNLDALSSNYDRLIAALDTVGEFGGPTLFVSGEASDYLLPGDHHAVRRLFPRAEFRTIAGAGHWLHTQAPAAFVQTVVEFLTRE